MKIFKYLIPTICILSSCLSAVGLPHKHHLKKGNAAFAFDLYHTMREETENMCISPYSISSSLALAMMGAEGGTHHQMAQTLHLPHEKAKVDFGFLDTNRQLITHFAAEEEPVHLSIANGLFYQEGAKLHHEYLTKRMHFWSGGVQPLNFASSPEQSRQEINGYVSEKTCGLIGEIMPAGAIDSNTRMVLVNALYLKAPWKEGFNPENNFMGYFQGMREDVQLVEMMHKQAHFQLARMDGYNVLEMPFKEALSSDTKLALYVVLPDINHTLKEVEEKINFPLSVRTWVEVAEKRKANLAFPKCELSYSTSLKAPLIDLGMWKPFCSNAGFPWGNDEAENLVLTDVLHKTTISFDEGGVLATAATGSAMGITCYEEPIDFIADRPFMYMIVDKNTHTILFMGRVANIN